MMKISSLPMRLSLKRKDVVEIKLRTILSSLKYHTLIFVGSARRGFNVNTV